MRRVHALLLFALFVPLNDLEQKRIRPAAISWLTRMALQPTPFTSEGIAGGFRMQWRGSDLSKNICQLPSRSEKEEVSSSDKYMAAAQESKSELLLRKCIQQQFHHCFWSFDIYLNEMPSCPVVLIRR
jgi:hypothetical protein